MLANSKIDLDAFDLQTSRRSHLAYQKISTKPNEFTPCARKEAFNQMLDHLKKTIFSYTPMILKIFNRGITKNTLKNARLFIFFQIKKITNTQLCMLEKQKIYELE